MEKREVQEVWLTMVRDCAEVWLMEARGVVGDASDRGNCGRYG